MSASSRGLSRACVLRPWACSPEPKAGRPDEDRVGVDNLTGVTALVAKALALVAIVAIGYGIKKLGWASPRDFTLLSHIVLRITMPAALITYFNDFTVTWALLGISALAIAFNVIQQVIGYLLTRHASQGDRAFAVLNSGSYNIGAFSMPYIAGFLGPGPVLYTSMFDIGNSVGSAGVGYGWGMSLAHGEGRPKLKPFLGKVAQSHLFWLYLGLAAFRLADLHVPGPLLTLTSTVGAANPFMAMLMIGVGLEIRLHRSKYAKAAKYLAVRYACSTVFALAVWFGLPMSQDVRMVIVMLLFAPMASMLVGFTAQAKLDVETSAFMTSVTILVAIVVMPALMLGLG